MGPVIKAAESIQSTRSRPKPLKASKLGRSYDSCNKLRVKFHFAFLALLSFWKSFHLGVSVRRPCQTWLLEIFLWIWMQAACDLDKSYRQQYGTICICIYIYVRYYNKIHVKSVGSALLPSVAPSSERSWKLPTLMLEISAWLSSSSISLSDWWSWGFTVAAAAPAAVAASPIIVIIFYSAHVF